MMYRNPKYWWDKTKYCLLAMHKDMTHTRLYFDTFDEMDDSAMILCFSTYTVKMRGMIQTSQGWKESFRYG